MNKRKFKRSQKRIQSNSCNDEWLSTKFILGTVETTVSKALNGEPSLSVVGNFIFLSTITGEGWMLDHRDNLALRLANAYERQDFQIMEEEKQFLVEWQERFSIQGNTFVATIGDKQSVFYDYPIDDLKTAIEFLSCNE